MFLYKSANDYNLRNIYQEINPKQTLGTVLVLCGWKLYFSIYHPMHNTKRVKNSCGFDCSSDDDTTSSSESNDDVKKIRSQKEVFLTKFSGAKISLVEGWSRHSKIQESCPSDQVFTEKWKDV